MTNSDLISRHTHDHVFGQDRPREGERRTAIVVIVTAVMMVVEIIAGVAYGSMALLADGLHMASHAVALGMAVAAYVLARRLAADSRFGFGTGKINALAGFASAVLLAGFALLMAIQSVQRLVVPVEIQFDYAIAVAVVGLAVNGACALVLGHDHAHQDEELDVVGAKAAQGSHHHEHRDDSHDRSGHHHDHNLRAAYFHVLADALTSLLAIFALLAGKLVGAAWLDPTMGIVGALLVARWSWGLMRQTGAVLLDHQAPQDVLDSVREAVERDGADRVVDLHVWSIGPGIRAAQIALLSDNPREPADYKRCLPASARIVHVALEVNSAAGSSR